MHNVRKMTDDLYWVGVNDKKPRLFEGLYPVDGVSYNAYVLLDDKTVLFDTVDWSVTRQFLENMEYVLNGRPLDYLVVNHMEPDHAAAINEVLLRYPEIQIIATKKARLFMRQFGIDPGDRFIEVREGDIFGFGNHEVTFAAAPMVHWPEVMMTYDITARILFSADAFGSFGSLDGALFADELVALVAVLRLGMSLRGDGDHILVHSDVDVLLLEAGEIRGQLVAVTLVGDIRAEGDGAVSISGEERVIEEVLLEVVHCVKRVVRSKPGTHSDSSKFIEK